MINKPKLRKQIRALETQIKKEERLIIRTQDKIIKLGNKATYLRFELGGRQL